MRIDWQTSAGRWLTAFVYYNLQRPNQVLENRTLPRT